MKYASIICFVSFFAVFARENGMISTKEISVSALKQTYWENGVIRDQYYVRKDSAGNEIKDGIFITWGPKGEKAFKTLYRDGKDVGPDSQWDFHGNVSSLSHTLVRDSASDRCHSIEWHQNGKKKSEVWMVNGKEEGVKTWWHNNGQKEYEGNCRNGVKDGIWTGWYKNGNEEYEGHFTNGYLNGPVCIWYENGQKLGTVY